MRAHPPGPVLPRHDPSVIRAAFFIAFGTMMTNLDGMLYRPPRALSDLGGQLHVLAHCEGVCGLEVTNCDLQFRRQKDLARKIEARHFMDRRRNPEIRP